MSGWIFEVEKRRVKTKVQTVTVRAWSQEGAIECAQRAGFDGDAEVTTHTEYVAREIDA